MAEEKKSKTVMYIVIAIIVIVIIFVIAGNSNQLNNSQPHNNQAVGTTTQSLQDECDTSAKNYFDDYKSKNISQATPSISYDNHYDKNNGSCYVLTNSISNESALISQKPYYMVLYSLVDVSRKDPTGQYEWIGQYSENVAPGEVFNGITDCNVGGNHCSSLKDFLTLVNPYLGK